MPNLLTKKQINFRFKSNSQNDVLDGSYIMLSLIFDHNYYDVYKYSKILCEAWFQAILKYLPKQ